MTNRDDMVITPQIAVDSHTPRARAREERKTRAVRRKRRSLLRRLRNARSANKIARSRGRTRSARRSGKKNRAVKKRVGKAAPGWVGIALLAVDVITIGTQLHRRYNGVSIRLLEAQNADTVMGDLDEQAAANAEVLNFVESDHDLLRAIGRDGKVNASTLKLLDQMKAMALTRARGADMIARDPHFDSPDSLLDKLLMKSEKAGLRSKADEVIFEVRGAGHGKIKSGR